MTARMLGLVVSLGVVLAACSGSGGDTDDGDSFSAAAEGLCRTAEVADDPAAARDVFFDSVHQPLHQLADETAAVDRAAAAALLQAKQRVESSLESADPPLPAALYELIDTTEHALDTLDRPGPDCGRDR